MPNKLFLESSPLYEKVDYKIEQPTFFPYGGHKGTLTNELPKPAINMACQVCNTKETFNMMNEYPTQSIQRVPINMLSPVGKNFTLDYLCMNCKTSHYYFYIDFGVSVKKDKDGKEAWTDGWVRKIGQKPEWSIEVDKQIQHSLGTNLDLFKKGLICESQAYGIGAFSYYRRVLENIIAHLLEELRDLIPEVTEKTKFIQALDTTKKETIASNRIELVKDLLPKSLYVDGTNPLAILYETASIGLHSMDDQECLEYAEAIRVCLTTLIKEIEENKNSSKEFSEGIKKLLAKKAERINT